MKEFLPEVRRARFDKLTIYEISHSELELIERGSPDSIYLNLAIALLSIAASFTATLCTATVDDRIFMVFSILTTVGYMVGGVLLILWWRSRRNVTSCFTVIRQRLPPEGFQQPIDTDKGQITE